jgi:type I restriction enzyme S subunit
MQWEMKLVKDIFKIHKGKKAQECKENTGLRYIQIDDLRSDNNIKFCINNKGNVFCSEKDLLIAWDGANAGTIGYNLKGVIGSTLAKLSPQVEIDSTYAGRFLQSKFQYLRERCTGATIPHISRSVLEEIQLPLPPLAEQQRLAALLDTADALRRHDRALLTHYDRLVESVFLELFGDTFKNTKHWEIKKIEEVVSEEKHSIKAGPFGSLLKKEFYAKSGYKIYGQEQVIRDDLSFGDYYIDEKIYKKLESCKVQAGDILISLVGTYGKLSIVPERFEPGIINPRLMKISLDKTKVNPIFFKFLLTDKGIKTQIENFSRGGTMDIVNVEIIRNLKIPLPPLSLQTHFATLVHNIEAQKERVRAQAAQSEDLFQGLLQRVFEGF